MGKILNWGLAVLLGLLGIGSFVTSPTLAICFLLTAAAVTPPGTAWLKEKINFDLTRGSKIVLVIGLLIASTVTTNKYADNLLAEQRATNEAEQQEQKEKQEAENLAKFNSDKQSILTSIDDLFKSGEYAQALTIAKDYAFIGDADLTAITDKVKSAQYEERKAKETEEILTNLKTIPASDTTTNRDLYRKLLSYHPDNTEYKTKFDRYDGLVKQEQEKARLEEEERRRKNQAFVATYGAKPEQSQWDGSYLAVERHLKEVANDPDSIDISGCTEVFTRESGGWLVGCDFRGKNAFGGLVKNSNWFTIANGRVIDVQDSDAYQR